MAKAPKPKPGGIPPVSVSINGQELPAESWNTVDAGERNYVITEAKIKDDFCHYSFRTTSGVGLGEEHSVKVDNIIKDDLRDAFGKFNVHLAVIDDVFKHSGVKIEDVDKYHNSDLTMRYHVTGFKVTGVDGDENVVLTGSKILSTAGGRMDIKTPKIPLDHTSSYQWYNELLAAVIVARREVALYKEGKYEVPEVDEAKPNPKQMTIGDAIAAAKGDDQDFENARV